MLITFCGECTSSGSYNNFPIRISVGGEEDCEELRRVALFGELRDALGVLHPDPSSHPVEDGAAFEGAQAFGEDRDDVADVIHRVVALDLGESLRRPRGGREFGKFILDHDEEPYFTLPRLAFITRQCLIALRFVHKLGLVHSDVKPENILFNYVTL